MRLPFLNREEEKARLLRLLASREGAFGCVYGRRRTGKSRLLQEVLSTERAVYFVCDEREPALQRAALAVEMGTTVPGMDEVVYPDWASLLERWWREAPAGATLVLDEFPYLAKASSEVPSLLQRLLDQNTRRRLHLLVCGSSQRMMQGLVLDASAPLYGRAREILQLRPLSISWLGRALNLSKPREIVEAYALWGGIPRYWELTADYAGTWEAAADLVVDPMGVLHNEPKRLLLDDVRDTAQAASILALVGSGCHRLSEIAGRLGKPATSLTRPMHRLLELGLVRRDTPFGAPERSGKRTLYSIADPFLAFWFRHVEPNRSRLEAGMLEPVTQSVRGSFSMHEAAIWEQLARESTTRLRVGGMDWEPARRWWGAGVDRRPLEVDLVAQSRDGRALLVGEAKLQLTRAEINRARAELHAKAERLPFAAAFDQVVEAMFVAHVPGGTRARNVVTGGKVCSSS